ncbi:MAG: hypothetical protein ACLFUT_13370 [Desulfobacteraceae bacterium]
MHRLKELISDLFEIELDSLHNIEIQDLQFTPGAEQEIGKTLGEMSSLGGGLMDVSRQEMDQKDGVRCQGFWIESTRELVLYLWDRCASRAILLGRNTWSVRNDITLH